jgi:hypothetical protein
MLRAFEGGAGCGKTFALMSALEELLRERPLLDGQRVLALTFMHGAKRRLNERLRTVPGLNGRFECMTIDSFAWRIVRRWRTMARALGMPSLTADQYDQQCEAAAALLDDDAVLQWTVAGFPIVLLDEAQDLSVERVAIVRALESSTEVLLAADEFQCLNQELRPNPLVSWVSSACEPMVLREVHRTNVQALLAAARCIRAGKPPTAAGPFKIMTAQGPYMAPAFLANAISWRPSGTDVAIITPSMSGDFARDAVARVCTQACGKHQSGPFPIRWERSEDDERQELLNEIKFEGNLPLTELIRHLGARRGPIRSVREWAVRQARLTGKTSFSFDEVAAALTRAVSVRRSGGVLSQYPLSAMTVHQAKNREFDGVVVLWPFKLAGDDEQRRRLLYNAVTRARLWCTVILQGPALGRAAPFA